MKTFIAIAALIAVSYAHCGIFWYADAECTQLNGQATCDQGQDTCHVMGTPDYTISFQLWGEESGDEHHHYVATHVDSDTCSDAEPLIDEPDFPGDCLDASGEGITIDGTDAVSAMWKCE